MIWERKYDVATEVYGVFVTAGAAVFKAAPDMSADDFKISKDGNAFVSLGTTPIVSPAAGRQVKFALSAAEMQCKTAMIIQVDDVGGQWEDSAIIIETYGHASARHLLDRTEAMRGTDSGATAVNLATVDTVVDAIKVSTDRLTAVRAAILTDWIDGGRLDLILDSILVDTSAQILISTTIATLASQKSFTLTAGSSDNNAYKDHIIVITDASTSVQRAVGKVSAYVGSSKTITLAFNPGIFTMAATDKIDILSIKAVQAVWTRS